MTTYTLDWVSRHDPRSMNFPFQADGTGATRPVFWRPGPVLDQGQEGACVGFAWTDEATASPVRVKIPDLDTFARDVYHEARDHDQYEGEGSSVIAGAKAMVRRGYLGEYRWCFSIGDVCDAIHTGPVVLGIPWRYDMFNPDGHGEITATGSVAGGHAILANGYHPLKKLGAQAARPMIHLQNSWGSAWGVKGGAWIATDGLASLLGSDGEACVPVQRFLKPAVTA